MDVTRTPSAIVAAPAPAAGLGTSLPTAEIAVAWPRSAQLAAAFLLGAAATLLGIHGYSLLHATTQPAADVGPPALAYRVELNTATRGELLQLPGVGPALAERIEEYRRVRGGFDSVDDLLKVGGIGLTTLERLRPLVYVRPLAKPQTAKDTVIAKPAAALKKVDGPPALIDINNASQAELQQLPGIGPKKAQYIIEARHQKPFSSVDDLRRVSGIGPKTLDKLRPHVTVGEPSRDSSQPK
jgi:competence protein ComEA